MIKQLRFASVAAALVVALATAVPSMASANDGRSGTVAYVGFADWVRCLFFVQCAVPDPQPQPWKTQY